jgi:hypothetical protein
VDCYTKGFLLLKIKHGSINNNMATDYLLPVLNPTIQTVTYTGATSSVTGTLALTAAGNLVAPPLSGTTTTNKLSVTFTLAPNSTRTGVSATSTGIALTQGSIYGNIVVYGKVATSTLNGSTSTITATINFNDPNYVTTNLYLSTIGNTGRLLSTSVIDNPLIILPADGDYTSTFGGLTSTNIVYRTVGRQVRLRQGYEA